MVTAVTIPGLDVVTWWVRGKGDRQVGPPGRLLVLAGADPP